MFRLLKRTFTEIYKTKNKLPLLADYSKYVYKYSPSRLGPNEYPMILPDWDNTPRSGQTGRTFQGSTPELFIQLCLKAFSATENKSKDEKIVMVKSWNEWAEGNYMEPDQKNGYAYLLAFKEALLSYNSTHKLIG